MIWNPFAKNKKTEPEHLRTGRWGEKLAASYLKKQGCKVIGSRVRVGKRDELDLIAWQDECLLFVEVKTRASERMGRPVSAVNREKRLRLARAAMRYMKRLRQKPAYFRFDVIEVVGREGDGDPIIRHLPNVFTLPPNVRVPW